MSAPATSAVWVVGDVATDMAMTVPQFPLPGDDVFCDSLRVSVGGCGGTMAMMLAKLGHRPVLIASIGDDLRGKAALTDLRSAGVDTSLVSVLEGLETHLTVIVVTPDGERTIFGHPGASGTVDPGALERLTDKAPPGALLVSGYCLYGATRRDFVAKLISKAADLGAPIILDLPVMIPDSVLPAVADLLEDLDTVIVGATEACRLAGVDNVPDAQGWLSDRAAQVLIKNGASEVLLKADGHVRSIIPPAVSAVDSTGAGDVFSAAFVAARISGLVTFDALAVSCLMAAVSTTRNGNYLPGPTEALSCAAISDSVRAGLSSSGLLWLEQLAERSGR